MKFEFNVFKKWKSFFRAQDENVKVLYGRHEMKYNMGEKVTKGSLKTLF